MNARERYRAVTHFEKPDRPFVPFEGMWPPTANRWKKEGWDGSPLDEVFHLDPILRVPVTTGPWPPFERKIIEDTPQTLLYVDPDGVVRREFKGDDSWSSMPQFVKHPVETEADFDRLARKRLGPKLEERFPKDWPSQVKKWRKRTTPLIFFAGRWGGFFGPLRNFLGLKELCRAFYERPEFVETMMDQRVEVLLAILERVLDHIDIDAFGFWEDMAYRTGPLPSPEMVREYMVPRYRIVSDYLRSRGVDTIYVDSDGDVRSLIPLWLKGGLNGVEPLEVQAGMDVPSLRQEYGRDLVMLGGIDKRALARGAPEIEAEVDRVWPMVAKGGYVPRADHWLPSDISFENLCHYQTYRARKAGIGAAAV
jgi:uroporphyrinogen decarboxylase